MSNNYKILLAPYGDHAIGDEAELDLTADEESDLLAAHRVEIVPRPYKVVGTSRVYDSDPGEVFLAALRVENEAALVEYGQIERAPRTEARKKEAAKELKKAIQDKVGDG